MKKVTVLSRKKIYQSFFGVEECEVQYGENTGAVMRSRVTTRNASGILLQNTDTGKLILARQFRMGAIDQPDNYVIEIPAGVLDNDEDPESCARREIIEETGFQVKTLEKIGAFYVSPGYTNEKINLFFGTTDNSLKLHDGGGLDQEHEFIEILEFTPEECMLKITSGEICDAKTTISILWLLNNRHKIPDQSSF